MKTNFSHKIYLAVGDAASAHEKQRRKGDRSIPYIAHPVALAIALSHIVDDEDIIIAALLHDTLEDTTFPPEQILQKYGARVLSLVQAVSEEKDVNMSDEQETATWLQRKAHMVQHVATAAWEIQLIKFADNLQNLQSILQLLKEKPYEEVVKAFHHATLGARVGLYHHYLDKVWKPSRVIKSKCSAWLTQYESCLQELQAIVVQHGGIVVPFVPDNQ